MLLSGEIKTRETCRDELKNRKRDKEQKSKCCSVDCFVTMGALPGTFMHVKFYFSEEHCRLMHLLNCGL